MFTTTTQDYTSVSWSTGDGIDGAILHVSRIRWTTDETIAKRHLFVGARWTDAETGEPIAFDDAKQRFLDGDEGTMIGAYGFLVPMSDDGRCFASLDEARAFALERGYTQPYFTAPELRTRRVQRAAAESDPRFTRGH